MRATGLPHCDHDLAEVFVRKHAPQRVGDLLEWEGPIAPIEAAFRDRVTVRS
jgi:hypothetical protein